MFQTQRRCTQQRGREREREQMQFSNKGILNKNSLKNFLFKQKENTHIEYTHI